MYFLRNIPHVTQCWALCLVVHKYRRIARIRQIARAVLNTKHLNYFMSSVSHGNTMKLAVHVAPIRQMSEMADKVK